MATRTEYHAATGQDFMEKARAYLAEDDLLQASEKGWGAAAQAVKAIAEARGWRHKAHADLYRAIDRLCQETGNSELVDLFGGGRQPPHQLLRRLADPQNGRPVSDPC